MVEPPCSNFRVITANFWVSKFLGFLRGPVSRVPWHTVNLLIFAAMNFRVLCLDCHFTVIHFRVSDSSLITYIEDLTQVVISYEMSLWRIK